MARRERGYRFETLFNPLAGVRLAILARFVWTLGLVHERIKMGKESLCRCAIRRFVVVARFTLRRAIFRSPMFTV